MPKYLTIAFTGNAVLTPDYPDIPAPAIPGPLVAVLPGSRQRRPSSFNVHQIDAQFAFLVFPYRHIVLEEDHHRDADYKHPDLRDVTTGLCFLEREDLFLETGVTDTKLTFDNSPITTFPTTASTGTGYIARWKDFAPGGDAKMRPEFLQSVEIDAVRVTLPGGFVQARFAGEPIARIDFDYGPRPIVRPYAQEIIVRLEFPDDATEVSLGSIPFENPKLRRTSLVLRWHDATDMRVLIGNGAFASILNVLNGSFTGRDHEGDFDLEFEVVHPVVECRPDQNGRMPVPRVMSREVLRVPCLASMVASPGTAAVNEESLAPTRSAPTPEVSRPSADPFLRKPRRTGRRSS